MSYSSYIAGLDLPFTGSQAFNGLAWTTAAWAFYRGWPGLGMKNKVEAKAGKAVHMPPGRRGELITALHGIPLLLPGATFLISLPLNNFETPDWLSQFALPPVSPDVYCGTRVGASLGILVSGMLVGAAFKHLGAQWNYIGVRERPELINTGPYRYVRHPMYSAAMLMGASSVGAFWNWMPLPALGLMALAFGIKMPMEEGLILSHPTLGPKYKEFKKQVLWRVIPYIW
ncbi:hypothetical protein CTheo_3097 [Ceratobasidium theobromae]|uniref:Protein-S-isoprenylcysteine O-methyltransferase n=1 Tax=Ceratobasidium theobromae TaxID=1582974 RepID=A0A5N5QPG2_9AGAM|nr:hypothetical protein CTheo_3097 [Ceratobasidium theobromae]